MRVPADHKASGNAACLELAEECVAEIKKGRIRYFASVMCENAGHVDSKHGGSTGCEFAALAGLEMIRDALKRPSPGPNASAANTIHLNYACYDLHRAPLSFDFAPWLVDREMVRVRFGAPGPLRVAFTEPDPGRVSSENNLLMLEKVIMPMVEMIGGVIDPVAVTSRARAEFYCNRPIVDAAKAGETVPMLRPNAAAMEQVAKLVAGRPPVTITLREALHDSPRNSRTEEWLRFAAYLRDVEGERVIIIRDTARADEPLFGFETYPVASRNLQIRLALYAQAKCNFFVSNGPVTLAMFSEAPYVFINEVLDYQDSSNKTESWTLWHGTNPGEQVPWAKPNQRIVWGNEEYDVIRAAWDDFVAAQQNIAA